MKPEGMRDRVAEAAPIVLDAHVAKMIATSAAEKAAAAAAVAHVRVTSATLIARATLPPAAFPAGGQWEAAAAAIAAADALEVAVGCFWIAASAHEAAARAAAGGAL
jgi:hypothetical protein